MFPRVFCHFSRRSSDAPPPPKLEVYLPYNLLPEELQGYRWRNIPPDIKIRIGKAKFGAHKAVLEHFRFGLRARLSETWLDSHECRISEEIIDPEIFKDLLDFFYDSNIVLTVNNVKNLCVVADLFELPFLKEECVDFITHHIDFFELADTYKFATKISEDSLRKRCIAYAFRDADTTLKESKFTDYTAGELENLFKDLNEFENNMNMKEKMFELLNKWTKKSFNSRSVHLPLLLNTIPLNDLCYHFLEYTVCSKQIITRSPEASNLVQDALIGVLASTKDISSFPSTSPYLYRFVDYLISYLDCSTGEYQELNYTQKSVNSQRKLHCGLVVGNKAYFCTSEVLANSHSCRLEVFDLKRNHWTVLCPLPYDRSVSDYAIGELYGKIYLTGGTPLPHAPVYEYSIVTNRLKYLNQMWYPRYNHKVIALNDGVCAIGGKSSSGKCIRDIEAFSVIAGGRWWGRTSLREEEVFVDAIAYRDKMYVVYASGVFLSYYPDISHRGFKINEWDEEGSFPHPLSAEWIKLFLIKDQIFAVSDLRNGCIEEKEVYEYDADTKVWARHEDWIIPGSPGHYFVAHL